MSTYDEYGTIVSTNTLYTFPATTDRTLTAIFEPISGNSGSTVTPGYTAYQINVSATSNGTTTVQRSTARAGDKVIITAKPNDGYIIDRVSVTDRSGNSIYARDNRDGTYTFTMPADQAIVNVTFTAISVPSTNVSSNTSNKIIIPMGSATSNTSANVSLPFTDVSFANWFYPSVQYVYTNGLMTGDGSAVIFNPNGNTTRAMVWTVLGRMADADVESNGIPPWYTKARNWAISNSISDGSNPTTSISRQELMTMLWRYIDSPSAAANLNQFNDYADVAAWADGAMQWAVSTGIIVGDNGRLNPGSNAKRSEVAAIFMRFCEATNEKPQDNPIEQPNDGYVPPVSNDTTEQTPSNPQTNPEEPQGLSISTSVANMSSIVGSMYTVDFTLSAFASGGSEPYSYKFEIVQNGEVTNSTDWSEKNAISTKLSGNGTCVVRVTVRDSSGETASTTVNLLESSSRW